MSSRGKSRAKPEGLSQLNLNAAGIDVGATSHYVAVPADRAEPPVREYEAFTADLYRGLCPNLSRRRPPIARAPWGDQKYQWSSQWSSWFLRHYPRR